MQARKMWTRSPVLTRVMLVLALALATSVNVAIAQEQSGYEAAAVHVSMDDVETMLEAKGYQVGNIELREDIYEVQAIDVDGTPVAIRVDARTGEMLSEQRAE